MIRQNNIERFSFLALVFFLSLNLVLFLSAGCKGEDTGTSEITEEISGETAETVESEGNGENGEENIGGFPGGFPSSVPVYPGASIVESVEEEVEGKAAYKVVLHCPGDIGSLSEWYKQELEEGWSLDSISEGDMGDWSEFFAEARNEDYFLTVYLYQEEGSSEVSIDLNVQSLSEGGEIAESLEEDMEETSEDQGAEETESQQESTQSYSGELEGARIVLLCASVGTAWNISEHFPGLNICSYDEYQFDKSDRIREILDSDRPDILIIKECAAYFPPDYNGSTMSAYQNLIGDWVDMCRDRGVIPVLTTVVPIDPATNSGQVQLDSILEFNDWIKQYCSDENISVLDLEGALRISDSNRALDPAYDSGDGLHPNDIAYTERLDNILIPALERALEIGY